MQLRTLVLVAQTGSFSAAARQLAISPAMVGRRIKAIEDRHGARLIERTTRSLRFTATGQDLVARASAILEALDDLMEVAQQPVTQISGKVRLSAPVTLGTSRLVRIVSALAELHPELHVELSLSDRNVDLVREGFDLAVRIGELAPSGLIARRVGTYRLICCAAPEFLARHGMPTNPAQTSGYPCVINANLQPRDRWPFRSPSGQSIIVAVSGRLELDNDEAQRLAALSGAGMAYVPHHLVDEDILAGRLIEVFAEWQKLELPVQIVLPSRRLVPRRVTALVEAIVVGLRDSEIGHAR